MYSIDFPRMFKTSKTQLKKDHDAIRSNLNLLLQSEKRTLFGDPFYGTKLKPLLFEQNSPVVKDLIIDEIYTSILMFMPQLVLNRSDIYVYQEGVDIKVLIKCTYYLDQTSDLYEINLTRTEDSEQGTGA